MVCWFLGKNHSNFISPVWKLHNPYWHTLSPMPLGISNTSLAHSEAYILSWLPIHIHSNAHLLSSATLCKCSLVYECINRKHQCRECVRCVRMCLVIWWHLLVMSHPHAVWDRNFVTSLRLYIIQAQLEGNFSHWYLIDTYPIPFSKQ